MSIPRDKLLHFAAGLAVSIAVGWFTWPAAGLLVAGLAGWGKEKIWDKKLGKGTYDEADFWWTVAGGAVGALIVTVFGG